MLINVGRRRHVQAVLGLVRPAHQMKALKNSIVKDDFDITSFSQVRYVQASIAILGLRWSSYEIRDSRNSVE